MTTERFPTDHSSVEKTIKSVAGDLRIARVQNLQAAIRLDNALAAPLPRDPRMTAKVQGMPSRFDALLKKAEDALESAFDRLEKATEKTLDHAKAISGIAETVEASNKAMDDKLNQTTNGGPPLDSSSSGPNGSSAAAGSQA